MNKKSHLFVLLMLPALSSCGGFSLDYIVEGDKYISYDFKENYYEHWDSELKNAEHKASFDKNANRILKYSDIGQIDKNLLIDNPYDDVRSYAEAFNLMSVDQSFYYGVQSKLFDGEAYCDGYYQRHRVQSNEQGFSVRFSKESDELTYFAMQFKATTNNQIECYKVGSNDKARSDQDMFHNSTIKLTITLYVKEDAKIVGYDFYSDIAFDNNTTNDGSHYKFYAFDLTEHSLSRLVGFSVTFNILNDDLIEWNQTKGVDIDYALFLYEVFFPYTYWH